MRKFATIKMLFIIICWTQLFAQQNIVNMFVHRSHTYQGTTLPYRLFIPVDYDSTRQYPLVLALHGDGEAGSDNEIQVQRHRMATSWADPVNQADYPAFVVAPQFPPGSPWVVPVGLNNGIYNFSQTPFSDVLATVSDMLDWLEQEFSIDENRLYVTGLSRGGYGTWDIIMRFPNRFAAAIPMSGGGDPTRAPEIFHLAVWAFHGENDSEVPVNGSRAMIEALEETGPNAVYTHCWFGQYQGLPDSAIAERIARGEYVFYTEYENGEHDVWAQSYDYPHLFPWVFRQYRIDPNAIHFTNLNHYHTLTGMETVTWNAGNPQDSVEIWYSPDAGESWQLISAAEPNSGSYQWNTELVPDAAYGMLRIFLKNQQGFTYGRDRSAYFSVNNVPNGVPFVKIMNREFKPGVLFTQNTLELELLAGDAEPDSFNVFLFYSEDGGQHFQQFDSYTMATDSLSHFRTIDLESLPNSNHAILKAAADDGINMVSDLTPVFKKQIPRFSGTQANHIAGPGSGIVTAIVVNPAELTGDRYHITFNDTSFAYKVYDVWNKNTGAKVLENARQLFDGISEGPKFEGIRLTIKDVNPIDVNPDSSGWISGSPGVEIQALFVPSYQIGSTRIDCIRYPADYRVTFFNEVVDTSVSLFGLPAKPMKFSVWNITENKPSKIVFGDQNNDQTMSPGDRLVILEPDQNGDWQLTWTLAGSGDPSPVPQQGDVFEMILLKPISSGDIYEIEGITTGIADESGESIPRQIRLYQNYPNPFNPSTTIRYYLPDNGRVYLTIYNLLGQKVRSLADEAALAGEYIITWDGKDSFGNALPSGVYFYRLRFSGSGNFEITKKMVLIK